MLALSINDLLSDSSGFSEALGTRWKLIVARPDKRLEVHPVVLEHRVEQGGYKLSTTH